MSFIVTIVMLAVCATTAMAASAFGPAVVHHDHPTLCYNSGNKKYYASGESWQLDGCALATCNLSNHTGTPKFIVAYESCGVVNADPPCYVTEESQLAYPDCCPQALCPEDETENVQMSHHSQNDEDDEYEDTSKSSFESTTTMEDSESTETLIKDKDNIDNEVIVTLLPSSDSKDYEDGDIDSSKSDYEPITFLQKDFLFPYQKNSKDSIKKNSEWFLETNELENDEDIPTDYSNSLEKINGERLFSPRFDYIMGTSHQINGLGKTSTKSNLINKWIY